jgi:hypothetical protein
MRRHLVVANQTLGGQRLLDLVAERNAQGRAEFHVLVPATPTVDDILSSGAMYGGVLGAEGLALPVDAADEHSAHERAEKRLQAALQRLAGLDVLATGEVGDADPIVAIEEVLAEQHVDEIILSTLPPGISRWLKIDLVNRATRRFDVEITHVYAAAEPAPT